MGSTIPSIIKDANDSVSAVLSTATDRSMLDGGKRGSTTSDCQE